VKIKTILISLISLLVIFGTIIGCLSFFFIYLPGKDLQASIASTISEVQKLEQALSSKDIKLAKEILTNSHRQIQIVSQKTQKFAFLANLPKLKYYYQDSQIFTNIATKSIDTGEIVVGAIEPYSDFLGLASSSTDSAKTTQDRITFLTQSVEGLIPHLNSIEAKFGEIKTDLDKIDPTRYPENFRGYPLRSYLMKAKQITEETYGYFKDSRPLLEKTAWLLGKDKPRNYLLIFQNDAELRPTGGFWTAYGILKVDNGKVTPVVSDDIYALDAKFQSTIPAPRPIKSYHINVPYWNLRDMNLSPDFPESIKTFLGHYNKISGNKDKIDAVVAIDTQVLVNLVKVLGRVGVSGWGNFSSDPDKRCDGCPQIIYQLEWIAGRPRNYIETDRKGFLGPLMQSILSNAMGSEKSKIPLLVETAIANIHQKHLLFYFLDPKMQEAAVVANVSGSITQTPVTVDYFHLNDANMSSAKTNLFLTQKIKHEIISQSGVVEHKVSVTYQNPSKASNCNLEKGDLCLNAPKYRNWFRFYLPTGSKLVKMTGSEVDPVLYEELGKQVFEGFYGNKYPLYAQSSLKTSIQYTSPIAPSNQYSLYLQKQPGTKAIPYELWVNGQKYDNFSWTTDKTIKLSL
jgi:hypothetical protein